MCNSDPDFSGKIDPRFSNENRIAIEKTAPEPHSHRRPVAKVEANLVNFLPSDRGLQFKIDPRFSCANRTAILKL